ncbi:MULTISPECIES: histidine phosphatase family protein [Rubrivivax]|uniref:Histidine phosphatase family protein n=1 Tax=Rubrivivax benzoatilyticus TaxID=316997 RepID=A0ABX0HWX2_9BURK|nr:MULTISPECIES: histidine phosphatase family protein [Rubrivivax]MCD0417746.1 histidine phosphatase family protein [Rubrivivax sp. JA1024]EGJ10525.1 phosphohistidine phosphatase, SixA [Rubrivivax benzoatilyticus JA2 = ATCC BAA-35]MCC9598149.1 histidine phosphatase family protein [Rubrivivax sp. JA1055]MCC9645594.1 histidine phosphatase family protein [Rubrivivax sp. JA1029]NHK99108.1 histidine phosphatase family protein [Rubrivivax benzoatilyticus]
MDLILWRHAEAFDAREGQNDLERELTPKGERQARRVAAWLNRQLPAGTRVLASPARRAQQTAAALERRIKTVAELAPDASVEALLHATRWPEAREPVLVVGHQPILGLTAALLLSGEIQAWTVRKAGVWWLRSRERGDTLQVVLHAVVGPEAV